MAFSTIMSRFMDKKLGGRGGEGEINNEQRGCSYSSASMNTTYKRFIVVFICLVRPRLHFRNHTPPQASSPDVPLDRLYSSPCY